MANINGLSIKKVRSFVGPEGHVYQGDLYLGKKKIAFWSQDANGGIEDHLTMEPEYSEAKLRKAIIAANSDKAIVLHPNGSNNSFTIDYDIEELMYDLLFLLDSEKEWKKGIKGGYSGLLQITDGYHIAGYHLPDAWKELAKTTDEALHLIGQNSLKEDYEKMRKGRDIKAQIFWNDSDFSIGNPILMENILK